MIKPMHRFILVKINKEDQKNRREKIGRLIFPPLYTKMRRELQYGEIVSVGYKVKKDFPHMEEGMTILFHHFVSGKEGENTDYGRYHIHTDEIYNYYLISGLCEEGRDIEYYGVWDGEKIIPHPTYIFLQKEQPPEKFSPEDILSQTTVTAAGILVFNNWKESREERTEKMEKLKSEIQNLSRGMAFDKNVAVVMQEKEQEMDRLAAENRKKQFLPYTVAYCNPKSFAFDETDFEVPSGTTVFALENAVQTEIDFVSKTYRVAKIDYIGLIQNRNGH